MAGEEQLMSELPENKVTHCGMRSYDVVQESSDFFIIKDEKGNLRAIEKESCGVERIRAFVPIL